MAILIETVFRVGERLRCRPAIPQPRPGEALNMVCHWQPTLPSRPLTGREWKDYRRGRDALLAEAAKLLGGKVLCIKAPAGALGKDSRQAYLGRG